MASSPVAVLVIIGIYVVMFALINGIDEADAETFGLETDPGVEAPSGGLFEAIGDVFSTITGVISLVLGAFTFNVDGAPWFVRLPIAIAIIATLSWALATLIRGN